MGQCKFEWAKHVTLPIECDGPKKLRASCNSVIGSHKTVSQGGLFYTTEVGET